MTNPPRTTAWITGLGTATPVGSIDQANAAELCVQLCGLEGDAARLARALHRRSGIDRRGTVLLPHAAATQSVFAPRAHPADRGPTTAERMRLYAQHAPDLAVQAARDALADAHIEPERVTHLVTVSCTGFAAPGVELELIARLSLAPHVQRLHIGFMGCHGVINALAAARSLAADGACVLVVSVELCTLHLHVTDRPDQLVANALFADGAAACVVESFSPSDSRSARTPPPHPGRTQPVELLQTASIRFPGSAAAMAWTIGNHGFEMTLAESVPALIKAHLPAWMSGVLADQHAATPADWHWCIHPGGPRVLDAVRDALGLPESAVLHSRSVLRDHGNMSSATVLFILQRALRSGLRGLTSMLAFGPGLSAEACLLRC
jgi:predicted naringenin-chalcone synthase